MTAVTGDTTLVEVAPAGNRDFLHIYNVGDNPAYISYDGTPATVAAGVPCHPGGIVTLDNVGPREIYTRRVTAIGEAAWELRVQGA
jgi:hypothetical protein